MGDVLRRDFWVHLGALLSCAFGALDLWAFKQLPHETDLVFLLGGLAAMGVRLVNGAAAVRRMNGQAQASSGPGA